MPMSLPVAPLAAALTAPLQLRSWTGHHGLLAPSEPCRRGVGLCPDHKVEAAPRVVARATTPLQDREHQVPVGVAETLSQRTEWQPHSGLAPQVLDELPWRISSLPGITAMCRYICRRSRQPSRMKNVSWLRGWVWAGTQTVLLQDIECLLMTRGARYLLDYRSGSQILTSSTRVYPCMQTRRRRGNVLVTWRRH